MDSYRPHALEFGIVGQLKHYRLANTAEHPKTDPAVLTIVMVRVGNLCGPTVPINSDAAAQLCRLEWDGCNGIGWWEESPTNEPT